MSQPRMGEIGWGVGKFEAPKGQYNNYSEIMLENKNKNYVAYCNHLDNQKFTKLTGNFGMNDDKKLEINSEIFNLMNVSAQRISIKSLDMQRQSLERKESPRSPNAQPGSGTKDFAKQSFPDVVSILNNPFQKSHLNFAVKN